MKKYKVLIVDDSGAFRQMVLDILEKYPSYEVVAVATNGKEAIKEVILKAPDLITLDLEMPLMDGFTFLRWLMFTRPTRTIVISSRGGRQNVFQAMELGALDFIAKPTRPGRGKNVALEKELIRKLRVALRVDLTKVQSRISRPAVRRRPAAGVGRGLAGRGGAKVVVIASSTGGPPAIQSLLQALPADYPGPMIINQHMPAGFTELFSRRLDSLVEFRVKEAEDDETLSRGVYIAPGNAHTLLERNGTRTRIRLDPTEPADRYIPSADRLITSAARLYGRRCIGVILTGMGDDGVEGLARLKEAGGKVIAEHESTCVVYGMPRAAVEKGLPDQILPLNEIPEALVSLTWTSRKLQ